MADMARPDGFSRLPMPVLDTRLLEEIHIINLTPSSRIAPERLEKTAIPNLGCVELVSGPTSAKHYDELYRSNFHDGELERSELIVARLIDDSLGKRAGVSAFRIPGLRDPTGHALGAAHFPVLLSENGGQAVPYLQYIYIRPEKRCQHLGEVLHTPVLAVTMGLGAQRAAADKMEVPFTLRETEPAVSNHATSKRGGAVDRTKIHSKSSQAQYWPKPYLYQRLEDEGFPKESIAHAMRLAEARQEDDAEFWRSEITRDMYIDIDDIRARQRHD